MALAALAARPAGALAERPGIAPTRKRGQGHEIREIRPFTEGDDPRHLDAAATARSGALQVRSFHEDRERTVLLVADFRRPMLWGTRRPPALGRRRRGAGARRLAGRPRRRRRRRRRPDRRRPDRRAPPRRRRRHGAGLRRSSPAPTPSPSTPGRRCRDLAPDLVRAARFAPRGAGIVLATGLDAPGPGLDAALAGLARRGPLRLLLVEDAFETAPARRRAPLPRPRRPRRPRPLPDAPRGPRRPPRRRSACRASPSSGSRPTGRWRARHERGRGPGHRRRAPPAAPAGRLHRHRLAGPPRRLRPRPPARRPRLRAARAAAAAAGAAREPRDPPRPRSKPCPPATRLVGQLRLLRERGTPLPDDLRAALYAPTPPDPAASRRPHPRAKATMI